MYYSGICETGLKRSINQDSIYMNAKDNFGIFCVADGMGGHEDGEKASGEITLCLKDCWNQMQEPIDVFSFQSCVDYVVETLQIANRNIRTFTPKNHVCGSTVVVLLLWERYYALISAGDSRIYRFDGKHRLLQLTRDEVWENQPGLKISMRERKKYSTYGKLVNAVGVKEELEVHVKTDILKKKNYFLLCSDGLYKVIGDWNIRKHMKCIGKESPEQITLNMKKEVYDEGAVDNVSIIIVQAGE